MIKLSTKNIDEAFDILSSELKNEIDNINEIGASAMNRGEYKKAQDAIKLAQDVSEYAKKIKDIQRELKNMLQGPPKMLHAKKLSKRRFGKLPRGVKTAQREFYIPILRVINEFGGAGRTKQVLHKVGVTMQDRFEPVDLELLPSTSDIQRWYNTAQWARNEMREKGLIKRGSPRGIWKITDKGREYLERYGKRD